MAKATRIAVGMITGAHGIKGQIKVKSFTEDPASLFDYKPLTDEAGERVFVLNRKGASNDMFIVSMDGVADRNAAEALRGEKLYLNRAALPKTRKREYYQGDLVDLAVQDKSGRSFGKVVAVHDYGAGPFLEIGTSRRDSFMLPFNDACVPSVDMKSRSIIIAVPEGWLDKEKPDAEN